MKDIAILLPYKENFTENNAGAASIWVKDYLNKSKLKKRTIVYGNLEKNKPLLKNFKNLSLSDSISKKIFPILKNYIKNILNINSKLLKFIIDQSHYYI